MTIAAANPLLRIASLMTFYGLIIAGGGPLWASYLMRLLPEDRWNYRLTFVAACATALGGVFLQWFVARQKEPHGFPVLAME